jgi:hypothetical protein
MMIKFIKGMRLQSFLCGGWLLAVLVMFAGTVGNDMSYIRYLRSGWAGAAGTSAPPDAPAAPLPALHNPQSPKNSSPLAAEAGQDVQGLRTIQPSLPPAMAGRGAPDPEISFASPGQAKAAQEMVLRGVRFIEDDRSFRALFELDPAQGEISLHFQKQPPVHLLYVAGVWSYQGQEEYRFSHPLLRKVRIVREKDRLCLVFYYSDRRYQGRQQPALSWGDDGLLVAFTKES